MKEYNEAYRTGYLNIIQSLRDQLDQIQNYKIREQYDMLVGKITEDIVVSILLLKKKFYVSEGFSLFIRLNQ